MNFITIDQEKCKQDGICAATCPMGLIELKDEKSFPTPIEKAEEICITCGHCVAVCPHGALSLKSMKSEQCTRIQKELQISPEQAEQFLRSRRSVRVYKDKPVEKELIIRLIDTARYAPSGHNSQPLKWLVIYDTAELQRLTAHVADWMRYMLKEQPEFAKSIHIDRVVEKWESGIDNICRKAPHLIIAHAHKDNRMAPASANIALTYLELAAYSLGLGACWAGYFNLAATLWQPLKQALLLPDGEISYGAMMIGYAKFKYQRIPLRNEAKVKWF